MSDRVALVVTVLMSADVNCVSTNCEREIDGFHGGESRRER